MERSASFDGCSRKGSLVSSRFPVASARQASINARDIDTKQQSDSGDDGGGDVALGLSLTCFGDVVVYQSPVA